MGENEVWPPPPEGGAGVPAGRVRGCSRAASVMGVLSLVLTLSWVLFGIVSAAARYHWQNAALYAFMNRSIFVTHMLSFLPFVGLVLGICGWRSWWGKFGVAWAIVYCGIFFYTLFLPRY